MEKKVADSSLDFNISSLGDPQWTRESKKGLGQKGTASCPQSHRGQCDRRMRKTREFLF